MATQSAQFDLSTATLDVPKTIAYGLVRGAGNLILQQELADKSRVAFYMLGEGPWDSIVRLWINNKQVTLPSAATVHFHPGLDGEIGNGLTAASTGGDQHVDQFFALIPGGLDAITFSRYAWLALKVAPDPAAPSATLTVLADYQAMQVRQFDGSGNQTAFAWTQNWAWNICDFLIRKFILREAKVNQPLVAAELARFDWPSFVAAAAYYDAVLSLGQKRFSDGGVVFVNDSDTADRALEQMLSMCRSYILERNGKLSLYADQPRASVFTFTSDNVVPLSSKVVPSASVASSAGGKLTFTGRKSNLRAASNRLTATYRDLTIASGSTDDATRFAISTRQLDHEAHQRAVGARGPGLSVIPKVTELALDLGVNTPERVWRILDAMLVRQLGDDVDGNSVYNAPFSMDFTCFEDSLAVEAGDLATLDRSITEEFGGKVVEVLQVEEVPDGTRNLTCLEYMPNAFPDIAPAQQGLLAPTPGSGIIVDSSVYGKGVSSGKNLCPNPGFEFNNTGSVLNTDIPLGGGLGDGWFVYEKNATVGALFTAELVNTTPRSGSQAVLIRLNPNVSLPGSSGFLGCRVVSGKIPCQNLQIIRIEGFASWNFNIGIPAGFTIRQRVGLMFFDSTDTLVTELFSDTFNAQTGAYGLQQNSVQLAAATSSYMRVQVAQFVQNGNVGAASTPNGFCADSYFDDLMLVLQSTAWDLTPINTAGTPRTTTGLVTQVGATTAMNIASSIWQFGDGQVSYNSGSTDPLALGSFAVTGDDPTFTGGSIPYTARSTNADANAANGRMVFGNIVTTGGGGVISTGGGSGGGGPRGKTAL